MKEIRLLKASEIECRVGQCGKTSKGAWCTILLYKDARCDQRILDEVFGIMGWQRRHEAVNGQVCCIVKVLDPETKTWIEKEDVGTESNTEATKGQFSDSFKRACFNLGIGRELYTAPKIFINLNVSEYDEVGGKPKIKGSTIFTVTELGYDDNKVINRLVIKDKAGVVRYTLGQVTPAPKDAETEEALAFALPAIKQAQTRDELKGIYNNFPLLQHNEDFVSALNERQTEINNAA